MRLYEIFKREPVDQSLPYDEIDHYGLVAYHRERDDKEIGPHEGRYITLMLAGKKPAIMINPEEMPHYQKYVDSGQLTKHQISLTRNYPAYVLTVPGQEWRAKKLGQLYKNSDRYFEAGKESIWHSKIGILLGYSNNEIRAFLKRQ